jgi:hypothetical protein
MTDKLKNELEEMARDLWNTCNSAVYPVARRLEVLTSLQPAQEPVDYQIREIGEGDWMRVSKERMEAAINDPHIDYRVLYTSPFTQAQPNAELESMTRMFHAACADLGQINEALGLDPDDGGSEPILDAIEELKAKAVQSALSSREQIKDGAGDAEDARRFTEDQIVTVARALADRSADACNVNREDNWKIYGDDFIEDARAAIAAIEGKEKP